jgi:hypothetical protein
MKIDFINLYNHIASNKNITEYRDLNDRRFKVKLKAKTTNGSSYTFSFRGVDYYSYLDHHSQGVTRWLESESSNGDLIQSQGFLVSHN